MLILLAVICSLSSCVKEELIGPSEKEGLPVTIGVSMSALEATTKADTKSSATDDEATIGNRLVMVFKKTGTAYTTCAGFKYSDTDGDLTVATTTGEVLFVGIANVDDKLKSELENVYSNGSLTYSLLSSKVTSQILSNPKSLIKIGVKEMSLELTTSSIEIEVAQLTARVDFIVKATNGWSATVDRTKIVVNGVCTSSDLLLAEYSKEDYTYNSQTTTGTGSIVNFDTPTNTMTFYTYEKNKDSELSVSVTVDLSYDKLTIIGKTYTAILKPEIEGMSVTQGFIHGYHYIVTGTITSPTKMELTVKVIDWDGKDVNVNYGGDSYRENK